jgi:hypothetical protein
LWDTVRDKSGGQGGGTVLAARSALVWFEKHAYLRRVFRARLEKIGKGGECA